jgi:hypothetical protein
MKKTKAVLTGIDGVRAELKTLRKMHNNKYMCTFTVTDKDGNTMSGPHLGRNYRVIHGPCHADLQKYHPGSAYVLNVFPERLIPEATKAKAYIRWLMHESMYQDLSWTVLVVLLNSWAVLVSLPGPTMSSRSTSTSGIGFPNQELPPT